MTEEEMRKGYWFSGEPIVKFDPTSLSGREVTMTGTNGWPGKPGVPLNPERDGWHWVNGTPREWVVFYDGGSWRLAGSDYRPHEWAHRIYQGPCLTPDEATALQARVVELEAGLKDAAASVSEWGAYASQYLQQKWDLTGEVARYVAIAEGKKGTALEGKKP